jgi:uncharacterized membrane protein YeaQ/YmgE (transglycosylase-associated protein family)
MHLVWITLIGLLAGMLARFVTPGRKAPFGFMLTGLLGVGGAFAVAYLGDEAGWYEVEGAAGLVAAVFGAALVLVLWAFVFRSSRPTSSI